MQVWGLMAYALDALAIAGTDHHRHRARRRRRARRAREVDRLMTRWSVGGGLLIEARRRGAARAHRVLLRRRRPCPRLLAAVHRVGHAAARRLRPHLLGSVPVRAGDGKYLAGRRPHRHRLRPRRARRAARRPWPTSMTWLWVSFDGLHGARAAWRPPRPRQQRWLTLGPGTTLPAGITAGSLTPLLRAVGTAGTEHENPSTSIRSPRVLSAHRR